MSHIFSPARCHSHLSALGWALLTLMLFQGAVLGLVLCFEDNGAIAVEIPHQRASHTALPSHAPCLDRPLLHAGRLETSAFPDLSNQATVSIPLALPTATLPLLYTASRLTVSFLAHRFAFPPPQLHTTILLI